MLQQHSIAIRKRALVGLDLGAKVIGIATMPVDVSVAFPFCNLMWNSDTKVLLDQLDRMKQEYRIVKVIVGDPRAFDTHSRHGYVEQLINALRDAGYEVDTIEEHVTTIEAENRAQDAGLPKHERRDSIAAAIILERYQALHG